MESKTPENLNPNPIYKQNQHPKLSHKKKTQRFILVLSKNVIKSCKSGTLGGFGLFDEWFCQTIVGKFSPAHARAPLGACIPTITKCRTP